MVKTEPDNSSPHTNTEPFPEISLQDINKQLNSMPNNNSIMVMENVLNSYSTNKPNTTTESSQITPMAHHQIMQVINNGNNDNNANNTGVTLMDQQSSTPIIETSVPNTMLANTDYQMMNIAPTQTEFMATNNATMLNTIMNGLTNNNNQLSSNTSSTIDTFMPAITTNSEGFVGNGQNQSTMTGQLSCPMMTTECNSLINNGPVTVTMTEVAPNPTLNTLEQVNQNQIQQNILIDRINNAEMNQTNIPMAVDITPTIASPTTQTVRMDELGSFCQENKVELATMPNNISPETAVQTPSQVFLSSMSTLTVPTETVKSELQQPVPTPMQTNQNADPTVVASVVTTSIPTIAPNTNTAVLTNELTSAQSNINPMAKMSEAELFVFINPAAFDSIKHLNDV